MKHKIYTIFALVVLLLTLTGCEAESETETESSTIDAQSVFAGEKVSTKDDVENEWEHWTFNSSGTQFTIQGQDSEGEFTDKCYVSYDDNIMTITSCNGADPDEEHPSFMVNSHTDETINVTLVSSQQTSDFSIIDTTNNASTIDALSVFAGKKVSTKDNIDNEWEHWTFNSSGTQFTIQGQDSEGELSDKCYVSYDDNIITVTSCDGADPDEEHPSFRVNSYTDETINVTIVDNNSTSDFSIIE